MTTPEVIRVATGGLTIKKASDRICLEASPNVFWARGWGLGKASIALFFGSTLYSLQSAFSLKIRRVLISARAITNHDFTLQ